MHGRFADLVHALPEHETFLLFHQQPPSLFPSIPRAGTATVLAQAGRRLRRPHPPPEDGATASSALQSGARAGKCSCAIHRSSRIQSTLDLFGMRGWWRALCFQGSVVTPRERRGMNRQPPFSQHCSRNASRPVHSTTPAAGRDRGSSGTPWELGSLLTTCSGRIVKEQLGQARVRDPRRSYGPIWIAYLGKLAFR